MEASKSNVSTSDDQDAIGLVRGLDEIELSDYRVIGGIIRYSQSARNSMKDTKQRIVTSLISQPFGCDNYLIWAPPGSGKSFFVQEIAKSLGSAIYYRELNLAQLDEREFRSALSDIEKVDKPRLYFIDEVDSKPSEPWPYEALLPSLEPPVGKKTMRSCFVLAGSSGNSISGMKENILKRLKGTDLLSRIPPRNEFVIEGLGLGDRLLVASSQFLNVARDAGRNIDEVEKMVLYYVTSNSRLKSARQIRQLAVRCIERMPLGEERIKFDYLFDAGDPENKEFWIKTGELRNEFVGTFIKLKSDEGVPSKAPTPRPELAAVDKTERSRDKISEKNRIAVLPFTNISPDSKDEYFADGMTEELTSTISRISGLRVISRTSAAQFKNVSKEITNIGRQLNVGSLIEGSVRRAENRVRVSVQLINAETDEHIWAENYERKFEDVFAIQSEIAKNVADLLRVKLLTGERRQVERIATDNSEAHLLYFKGRYFWRQRTDEGLSRAIDYFKQAIELDPNYSLAYSGLADCYTAKITYGHSTSHATFSSQRAAALKAVELDPSLSEAHNSLAISHAQIDMFEEAEREFEIAVQLNSNYSTTHHWYAQALAVEEKFEKAIHEAEKARETDPLSPTTFMTLGFVYLLAGDIQNAVKNLEYFSEIDPNYLPTNLWLGLAYVAASKFNQGIRLIETTLGHLPIGKMALAYAYAKASRRNEALETLSDLEKSAEGDAYAAAGISDIYRSLGLDQKSLEWRERAVAAGDAKSKFVLKFYPWLAEYGAEE